MKYLLLALAFVFGVWTPQATPPGPLPAFPHHPQMKTAADADFCLGANSAQAFAALGVQGPGPTPEPDPFPEGETCEPATQTKQHPDHPCACHRQCAGTKDEPTTVEDPKCAQYCHKDHCACPTVCD